MATSADHHLIMRLYDLYMCALDLNYMFARHSGANQYATEGLEDYFMRVLVMYAAFGVASAILAMVAGVRSAWTLRKVGHDVQQAKERFLGNMLLVVLGCLWLFNAVRITSPWFSLFLVMYANALVVTARSRNDR